MAGRSVKRVSAAAPPAAAAAVAAVGVRSGGVRGDGGSYGLGCGPLNIDAVEVLMNPMEYGKLETVDMRMCYRCLIILIYAAPRTMAAARCCRSDNASLGTGMMCKGTLIRMWPD